MAIASCLCAWGKDNDKILNRPYADLKRLHFGFSVGLTFQDLNITNNGFITDTGESWFAEVPNHSPGFAVGVLGDLRLGKHLNLRFSPGLQFGNKVVEFHDVTNDIRETQNVKSTFITLPVDLKVSALRYHNVRPYFVGGVMGVIDVSKRRSEQLKLSTADLMLTVGLGLDVYLPFFKLCPELKFCFGLRDLLERSRPDLDDDPEKMKFTNSISRVSGNMVVLTFFFE